MNISLKLKDKNINDYKNIDIYLTSLSYFTIKFLYQIMFFFDYFKVKLDNEEIIKIEII